MAIDKKYSMWLSTKPWDENTPLQDTDFMYIGSSAQLPMNISYNSSTVGILGDTPDTAIFTDGVGGAVLKMNISATRPNMYEILGASTETPNTYSNKAFIEKLLEMRSKIQMEQNAYIFRIYNLSTLSISDYNKPVPLIDAKKSGQPKEIQVFIDSFDVSINLEQPNVIQVSISFIQRNQKVGYND